MHPREVFKTAEWKAPEISPSGIGPLRCVNLAHQPPHPSIPPSAFAVMSFASCRLASHFFFFLHGQEGNGCALVASLSHPGQHTLLEDIWNQSQPKVLPAFCSLLNVSELFWIHTNLSHVLFGSFQNERNKWHTSCFVFHPLRCVTHSGQEWEWEEVTVWRLAETPVLTPVLFCV